MKKIPFVLFFAFTLMLSGCTTAEPSEETNPPTSQDESDEIEALNDFYSKNLTTVYYQDGGMGMETGPKELVGADAPSFLAFIPMQNIYFGKDKSHVYRNGEAIEGIDGGTFEFMYVGKVSPLYAKDNQNVYILYDDMLTGKGSLMNFEMLTEADPASFKFFEHDNCASTPALYAHDDVRAYFGSKIIEGAEGKSFEHLAYSFAKDMNKVYYRGRAIVADAASFEVLTTDENKDCNKLYAKDKAYVYTCFDDCVIVEGADPKTFVVPAK